MKKFFAGLFLLFCLIQPSFSQTAVKFGNSYINLSKRTVGGTVQPGDTLEIRTNYFFPPAYNGGNIWFVRYLDNIPTRTTYIGDSLRLITNEGLTYKRWTNLVNDDPGNFKLVPPVGEYYVRINIGLGAAASLLNNITTPIGGGNVRPGTDRPRVSSGTLVTTAFKVRVTGLVGDTITLGAGQLRYKKTNNSGAVDTVVNAIQYQILISNNDPICSDAIGANFVAEAGGTFDSGTTQNRSYGPSFPIPNYTYRLISSGPSINDGYYTITNNLSPWASTFVNAERRNTCPTPAGGPPPVPLACANRMFNGHWDIMGDHTGTITAAGKPPTAVGSLGGYMLVVNADYATSEAYRQTITGLCPNTSYEFSLWIKNVCPTCGIDSTGTSTFRPGVYPNLTFAINGLDRYSSGQVDTARWLKKGFLFKTGMTQTSMTISIRNNASGGGGNDWAIDDIKLVTCNPNLNLTPSGNASVCFGNQVDISCVVRAFFNNYINYRWEKSIDNGATWTVAGTGTGVPVLSGGQYEYTAYYPSFIADATSHLNQYRFVVGSTPGNLADPNCNFFASTVIIVYVNNCSEVLKTQLLSFKGKLTNGFANLTWITDREEANTVYQIERSIDMINFTAIGTINGQAPQGSGSTYSFDDPSFVIGDAFYRLKISEGTISQYSKIVMLSNTFDFAVQSLVNPFKDYLTFELIVPGNGIANFTLIDSHGKLIRREKQTVLQGLNYVSLNDLGNISIGIYTLQIELSGKTLTKRVIKLNQ